MNTLRPGQTVQLQIAGETCEIMELLGSGGQGQVYHTQLHGRDYALKWYFLHYATDDQRLRIEKLIQKGPPNDRFLWPLDLADTPEVPGFGYIMPLREPRFRGMAELMSREVDPTFLALTHVAIELADSFLRLHSLGLCYTDISFGNIFFDPETGEVSICDNDNVAVEGEGRGGVLGTPRFMAPEIVRGEGKPGVAGDLYSLSVILFYMFMVHHPLEGKREREIVCLDLEAMRKLYGTDALFIFDPRHGANRPVAGIHNNATLFWNLYPDYLRDAFIRAFTDGLRDPSARVRESEWRSVFARMRDQIFYCQACGAENFLSSDDDASAALKEHRCWSCQEILLPPLRLMIGRHAVALNMDTVLYPHHLDPNRRNDYSEVIAEVAPHPTRANVWGFKNISVHPWTVTPPSGASIKVEPGRSVSIVPGLRIDFGASEGTVI